MIKKAMVGLVGLLLTAQAAFAQGILPMPSVRKQIYQEAKSEGVTRGLKRPSMRLQNENKTTVKATIYSMGRFLPGMKETRQPQKTATFKLMQTSEGKLTQPVRQDGKVWQQIYFARPLTAR